MKKLLLLIVTFVLLLTAACGKTEENKDKEADKKGKPDTWIADRKIKGLVFQSEGDVSPLQNKEVQALIKKKTGIELELQTAPGGDSTDALTAGLAAGDLPDFIAYYLNDSGRPEMKVLMKAAKQGQLTDLTDMLKDTKVYSKYFKDGYLPKDTKDNIMFRKDLNGTFLVHMSIPRNPASPEVKTVGGPYVRKDIIEKLKIDPKSIKTSEDMYELAQKIQKGNFKDENGKVITPIGPTAWGGSDRTAFYNDLVWTGPADEKFLKDKDGKIKHESQTDQGMERVKYVKKLMNEKLMHPEFYTLAENKAKEGIVNGSFGIVSDLHNYVTENQNMKYIPIGPLNYIDRPYKMSLSYKSGYAGWAIPKTTKNPEEIVKFADFLASREGKLIAQYGIEGRDYTLDKKGNPIVKKEVLDEIAKNPDEAKKRGFRGAGAYWAEHLGYTDIDRKADFGESEYGANARKNEQNTGQKIAEMWGYDEKLKHAEVIDGLTVKSFLPRFERAEDLETALNEYDEALKRAYYAKTEDESKKILDEAKQRVQDAGIEEFEKLVEEEVKKGEKIRY